MPLRICDLSLVTNQSIGQRSVHNFTHSRTDNDCEHFTWLPAGLFSDLDAHRQDGAQGPTVYSESRVASVGYPFSGLQPVGSESSFSRVPSSIELISFASSS
ncbi:hypothetical protein CF326_g4988 [Tilletia indica]|nr:hypothetical protein CF326_g4988 [Tilletia indica]